MPLKEYNSNSKSNLIERIYCDIVLECDPPIYLYEVLFYDGKIYKLETFNINEHPNHTKEDIDAFIMMKKYLYELEDLDL